MGMATETRDLDQILTTIHALEAEVGRAIIGQKEVVRQVLIAMLAGGHVLLEGIPGLGKTLLVRTLSQALDVKFSRIQFTPDLMPADITGTNILTEEDGRRAFKFQAGPIFASLVLADEINRATPKTQSSLLEAMQERTVTVGDQTRKLPKPFFVLATQNPVEQEGTYPLPEAQLDRFLLKVVVPFPQADELMKILDLTLQPEPPEVRPVPGAADVLQKQALIRTVPIAQHLKETAVRLVTLSHPQHAEAPEMVKQYVRFGAGPRAMQSLVLAAQARALLEGRFNVAAEDLQAVAGPAIRHRVGLNFEAQADGIDGDALVAGLWAVAAK